MRVLIISDIHSNLQALEAVLAAATQYGTVWNLGDIAGTAQTRTRWLIWLGSSAGSLCAATTTGRVAEI